MREHEPRPLIPSPAENSCLRLVRGDGGKAERTREMSEISMTISRQLEKSPKSSTLEVLDFLSIKIYSDLLI